MQINGPTLRKLRESQDVRQSDIARRMGVSLPRISTMESGRKNPGEEVAVRYLQALEDTLAERIGEAAGRVTLRIETNVYTFGAWASAPMMLARRRVDVSTGELGDLTMTIAGDPE